MLFVIYLTFKFDTKFHFGGGGQTPFLYGVFTKLSDFRIKGLNVGKSLCIYLRHKQEISLNNFLLDFSVCQTLKCTKIPRDLVRMQISLQWCLTQSYYNKVSQTEEKLGIINNIYFSQLRRLEIRDQGEARSGFSEKLLPGCRLPTSCYRFTWQTESVRPLQAPFIKLLTSIMSAPFSGPNYRPKSHLPISSDWRLGFQHMNCEGSQRFSSETPGLEGRLPETVHY